MSDRKLPPPTPSIQSVQVLLSRRTGGSTRSLIWGEGNWRLLKGVAPRYVIHAPVNGPTSKNIQAAQLELGGVYEGMGRRRWGGRTERRGKKRTQSWEGTEEIWEVDLEGTGEESGGGMRGKCDQNQLYIMYAWMYEIFKHKVYIRILLPSTKCLCCSSVLQWMVEREAAATTGEDVFFPSVLHWERTLFLPLSPFIWLFI